MILNFLSAYLVIDDYKVFVNLSRKSNCSLYLEVLNHESESQEKFDHELRLH